MSEKMNTQENTLERQNGTGNVKGMSQNHKFYISYVT